MIILLARLTFPDQFDKRFSHGFTHDQSTFYMNFHMIKSNEFSYDQIESSETTEIPHDFFVAEPIFLCIIIIHELYTTFREISNKLYTIKSEHCPS